MQHTPYGYDIVGGRAVVNEEQAAIIKKTCENYLAGMSFDKAAREAGLKMVHCQVKRMLLNLKYLGDGFYPPILERETVAEIEAERIKREKALGHSRWRKDNQAVRVYKDFCVPEITEMYRDPIRQAEYAYSLISEKAESSVDRKKVDV